MHFKGPGGFGRIMNIVMNIFMSGVFSAFMLWTMQQRAGDMAQIFTPTAFVLSFITGFGIGYATTDIIPVFRAGSAVAKKLNLKGVPGYFVTVLIVDLIVTTILSFLMTSINMVERVGVMGAFMSWINMLPLLLLIGYVVQLVVTKPAMMFSQAVSGFDPDNPMPQGPPAGMPPAGAPGGMPPAGPPAGMPPAGPRPGGPSN